MTPEFGFEFNISLALPAPRAGFGEGYNLRIRVYSRDPGARPALQRVLNQIDHKNLAKDLNLNLQPGLAPLAQWLAHEIKAAGVNLTELRIDSGDGRSVTCA